MVEVPNLGGNTQALIPRRFRNLQIGGKRAAVQQFFRALRRIRPAYDLGRAKIPRRIAACNMNSILTIPRRNLAIFRNQTAAAVVERFQKCSAILQRFLLGELCGNSHSRIFFVSARAQNMVNIILRNERRKSGRHHHAFRFINMGDLFFFRCKQAKEGQLFKLPGVLVHEWSAILISGREPAIIKRAQRLRRFFCNDCRLRFL